MQSAQRELRSLKQEETTLINLASKISDQLNRLKVEELALQNLVRLQNEEQDRLLRGSMSAGSSKMLEEQDNIEEEEDNKYDVDLDVLTGKKWQGEEEEEEEEEDDEIPEQLHNSEHTDIEQFVQGL